MLAGRHETRGKVVPDDPTGPQIPPGALPTVLHGNDDKAIDGFLRPSHLLWPSPRLATTRCGQQRVNNSEQLLFACADATGRKSVFAVTHHGSPASSEPPPSHAENVSSRLENLCVGSG